MPDNDNKWVGYQFTKRSTDIGGILMEIWQDDINHVTEKNEWRQLVSWVMMNQQSSLSPPNDHIDPPIYSRVGPVREATEPKPVQAPPKKLLSLSEQLEKLK